MNFDDFFFNMESIGGSKSKNGVVVRTTSQFDSNVIVKDLREGIYKSMICDYKTLETRAC